MEALIALILYHYDFARASTFKSRAIIRNLIRDHVRFVRAFRIGWFAWFATLPNRRKSGISPKTTKIQQKPSDNKEKDFVRAEFLPQALTSSYCLLAAIGREIDVFCQLDLSIVKRAL